MRFIDEHRGRFGVQPICRVLAEHGAQVAPSTYYAAKSRRPSPRAVRDQQLAAQIRWIWKANYEVYGAYKMWRELNRQGTVVARCTTERLMRRLGIAGVRRGQKVRTTVADQRHERAGDLLEREFTAEAPNRRWVADFTHVSCWAGVVYVAFVVDCFSRAIVGWAAAGHKRTKLVLDALEMGLWRRDRSGHTIEKGLIHHSDAGSQYTSFAFTTHLLAAGIDASVGSVGDALDNALMESTIGLYKTELINRRGPWRTFADVELATAEWVDWYNAGRIHRATGGVPPAEYESMYYAQHQPREVVGLNV